MLNKLATSSVVPASETLIDGHRITINGDATLSMIQAQMRVRKRIEFFRRSLRFTAASAMSR